jgi:Ran GTPase-activating protein (RanGAP) involved in mRNA processing and transport
MALLRNTPTSGRGALTTLNLRYNNITAAAALSAADAHALSTAADKCTLRALDLSLNALGDVGTSCVARLLASPHCALRTLNLSYVHMGNVGAALLAEALGASNTSTRLCSLNISLNVFDWRGVAALAQMLCSNVTLRDVQLASGELDDACAVALAGSLTRNKTLRALNLFGNEIGEPGAASLYDAVASRSNAFALNLDGNNFTPLI